MTLWVARAGEPWYHEKYALLKNVIVINGYGLSDLDCFKSRGQLLPPIQESHPDKGRRTVGIWASALWRFAKEFEIDDIVALPLKKQSGRIAFGRITGPYRFKPDAPDGAKHQRPVEWLGIIPRNKIDEDLLRSLSVPRTVSKPKAPNAEARIRVMLRGKSMDA